MAQGTICHKMFSGHVKFIIFSLLPHRTHRLVQNFVSLVVVKIVAIAM